jgi:hypothetical protein
MHGLLNNMLWIDSIRGDHSTGLIYQVDKKVDYYKKAVPGYDFVQLPLPAKVLSDFNKTRYLIGHNRAATLGSVNSANAHPFEMKHIIGVHNGTLSNHHSLTPVGVNYAVDSMHLYHAIADEGTEKVLPQVNGSFNLIWHDNRDDTIHLCRNKDRPFTFAKLKKYNTMIGASEKGMLKWLAKRHGFEIEFCWTPENNVEYVFEQGDGKEVLRYSDEIKHKEYVAPVTMYNGKNNYNRNNNNSNQNKKPTDITPKNFGNTEKVEFYLDTMQSNSYVINGKQSFTGYGEDVDGIDVIVNLIFDDDNIESETWYEGQAWKKQTVEAGKKVDYWLVDKGTVKEAFADGGDEAVHICQHCGTDSKEHEVVWIDNAPLCVDCCDSFQITEEWLDDPADVKKLKVK